MLNKNASFFLKIGSVFAILWSILLLILIYVELTKPTSGSEFDALSYFTKGLVCMILAPLQILILIISAFALKKRKKAWISLIILVLLTSILLPISGIKGFVFEISTAASLSVINEISPIFIVIILIFSWSLFFKKVS